MREARGRSMGQTQNWYGTSAGDAQERRRKSAGPPLEPAAPPGALWHKQQTSSFHAHTCTTHGCPSRKCPAPSKTIEKPRLGGYDKEQNSTSNCVLYLMLVFCAGVKSYFQTSKFCAGVQFSVQFQSLLRNFEVFCAVLKSPM